MRRERRTVLDVRTAEAVGCSGQVGVSPVEDGELLGCAWPDIAQIVDTVALKQRRDAATVLRRAGDGQEQVTLPWRLVVDREGRPAVAHPLKGPHDAASASSTIRARPRKSSVPGP
jgi:hypothetical protein